MASLSCLLLVALVAGTASTSNMISIKVVNDKFEPNTTTAAAGNILELHFVTSNSVVIGDFSDTC